MLHTSSFDRRHTQKAGFQHHEFPEKLGNSSDENFQDSLLLKKADLFREAVYHVKVREDVAVSLPNARVLDSGDVAPMWEVCNARFTTSARRVHSIRQALILSIGF